MSEYDDEPTTSKKKNILNKTMWLSAVVTALIFMYFFPFQFGQVLGVLIAIGFIVYCALPKPPKTKNSHTITIKRG